MGLVASNLVNLHFGEPHLVLHSHHFKLSAQLNSLLTGEFIFVTRGSNKTLTDCYGSELYCTLYFVLLCHDPKEAHLESE